MRLIVMTDVRLGYESEIILPKVSIEISQGDFVGVIGPNGGGKTTFIKALLGVLRPISGEVERADGLRIGYLPQRATIDRDFPISVVETVCSGGNGRVRQLRGRAMELLAMAGVEGLATRNISGLSGGEMQRVLLCRALIDRPQLLVLDEPTAYVDNKFEKDFYNLLHELNKELAIVMVSHDLGTITQHVKTIACVNRGFHHHRSNVITQHQLMMYDCPLQLLSHGDVPHTVLMRHK